MAGEKIGKKWGGGDWAGAGGMNPGAAMPWARARTPKIPPDTVPPRRVALDMTLTSQGPALLLRHEAVALEFLPMGAQLSLKAALPLAGILATASDRCRKTGPLQTPASPDAVHQRALETHDMYGAQRNKGTVAPTNVTSQSETI